MSSNYTLKLVLSEPFDRWKPYAHPFFPGDPVTGRVILDILKEYEISNIQVQFKGKCTTRVGEGKNEKKSKLLLFRFNVTLFRGPAKMPPGTYEYPFEFKFPETFKFSWSKNDSATFSKSGKLSIPPSCRNEDNYGGIYVDYTISAKIPRSIHHWKDKVRIVLSSWRTELDPNPKFLAFKSNNQHHHHFKIQEDGSPRPLGKREAMLNALVSHGHEVTTVNFTLAAKAPTVLVIGRPYSLYITLSTLSTDGNIAQMPEFYIKSYTLSLKQKSHVRVDGFHSDHTTYVDTHVHLRSGNIKAPLPVNASSLKIDNLFRWPTGSSVISNLTSGTFNMSYGLELKATVTSMDEDFEFKIHWPNVTLHPSRMEPGLESAIIAIENGATDLADESLNETLPPYNVTQEDEEAPPVYRPNN
ncbi:hypothetical protein BX600DRAFT_502789 [Xylariales sp. PMI_506]|nr:hypothetical protein BX600DRAFT_502789 [Xylariales sp. PMI_506]